MLYRPKYCCNCGERIERAEWGLLTSRRFCDFCSTENLGTEWGSRSAVALGLILGVFGFASFFGGTGKGTSSQLEPPVTVEKRFLKPPPAEVKRSEPALSSAEAPGQGVPAQAFVVPAEPVKPVSQPAKYFCGYPTKKGTPCSRKVKEKGARCYQHDGLELPE